VLGEEGYSWLQALAMAWDIRRGSWAEPEMELVDKFVQPGDTVVDIGAHYGMWTYRFDRAVGPQGRVFAFEPVPFTYATLCRVARLLPFRQTHLVPYGCAEQGGRAKVVLQLQFNGAISAGQSHLAGRIDERPGREQHVHLDRMAAVDVDLVRLDDALPDAAPISFIKADIEGAELFALRGAETVLARDLPTLVIEINPWFLEGFGLSVFDLVDFICHFGYDMYRFDDLLHRLVPQDPRTVSEDNYVFVHPSRGPQ
jgi:FkbM family methyltransferase